MKKICLFIGIFVTAGLLLWAFPFFGVVVGAPTDVDLLLVKSDFPDPVIAGNALTYTLVITNSGNTPATNVVLTDTLPGEVSFTNASPECVHDVGAGEVQCGLGSLDIGGSATVTITVLVSPSARGSITNTAFVIESDLITSTNTVSATTNINASANLTVSKDDDVSEVTAGEEVTYTYAITVTNGGPSLATGVVVTDTWPVSFTRGVVSLSQGSCDTVTSPTNFTCAVGDIPVGDHETITVTYRVPPGTTAGTQTNSVAASSAETSAPVSARHANAVLTSADLVFLKSDGVSQVIAGDGITYRYAITLTNTGPSLARGVVVTDTWPTGFTRGAVDSSHGSCDTATSPTNFTCAVGNIPVGGREAITVTYSVPPGTLAGPYTNTAEANDADSSGLITATDVTSVITRADVRLLSKLDDPDPVNSGEILTYTLSVTNFGPSSASGVVLTDNMPAGIAYNDSLSSPECSSVASTVTCPLGSMAPGVNRQVVIRALVTTTTPGQINNHAMVTASTTDPNTTNNDQNAFTTVDVGDPVVTWQQPVSAEAYYYVKCQPVCETVNLAVTATDDGAVQKVNFYRWDHVNLVYLDIGNDYTGPPYTWEFDTSVLPYGFNQIYAQAYDFSGNQSLRKRIFLVKLATIYFPVVGK